MSILAEILKYDLRLSGNTETTRLDRQCRVQFCD